MRRVLVVSTVFIVMSFAFNLVPIWNDAVVSSKDASRSFSSVPDDAPLGSDNDDSVLIADSEDDIRRTDGFSRQVVNTGKADRLFGIRPDVSAQPSSLMSDTPQSGEPERDAGDAPAELTTSEFCEALAGAAEASSIPVAFFARLIWQESKFKHDAMSEVGAQGVAQFMPRTAAEMGLDDPFDPRKALPASARFLRKLHDQFGNLGLAAAAYNAGSGRIQNWLARRGPLPDETRNYVRKITGNAAETWTSEKKTAALQQELPREAPCEGIGGLSRKKDVVAMAVELTPGVSDTIRKAEAAAARAIAAAKAKARLVLVARLSKRKGDTRVVVASADSTIARKTVIIAVDKKAAGIKTAALARAKARDAQADRRIKVASAR